MKKLLLLAVFALVVLAVPAFGVGCDNNGGGMLTIYKKAGPNEVATNIRLPICKDDYGTEIKFKCGADGWGNKVIQYPICEDNHCGGLDNEAYDNYAYLDNIFPGATASDITCREESNPLKVVIGKCTLEMDGYKCFDINGGYTSTRCATYKTYFNYLCNNGLCELGTSGVFTHTIRNLIDPGETDWEDKYRCDHSLGMVIAKKVCEVDANGRCCDDFQPDGSCLDWKNPKVEQFLGGIRGAANQREYQGWVCDDGKCKSEDLKCPDYTYPDSTFNGIKCVPCHPLRGVDDPNSYCYDRYPEARQPSQGTTMNSNSLKWVKYECHPDLGCIKEVPIGNTQCSGGAAECEGNEYSCGCVDEGKCVKCESDEGCDKNKDCVKCEGKAKGECPVGCVWFNEECIDRCPFTTTAILVGEKVDGVTNVQCQYYCSFVPVASQQTCAANNCRYSDTGECVKECDKQYQTQIENTCVTKEKATINMEPKDANYGAKVVFAASCGAAKDWTLSSEFLTNKEVVGGKLQGIIKPLDYPISVRVSAKCDSGQLLQPLDLSFSPVKQGGKDTCSQTHPGWDCKCVGGTGGQGWTFDICKGEDGNGLKVDGKVVCAPNQCLAPEHFDSNYCCSPEYWGKAPPIIKNPGVNNQPMGTTMVTLQLPKGWDKSKITEIAFSSVNSDGGFKTDEFELNDNNVAVVDNVPKGKRRIIVTYNNELKVTKNEYDIS